MKRLMLAAMHSGAGKTVATCALLSALRLRGLDARALKSGPDYIDPMFHQRVLGVPSRNLDLFLQGRAGVEATLRRAMGSSGEAGNCPGNVFLQGQEGSAVPLQGLFAHPETVPYPGNGKGHCGSPPGLSDSAAEAYGQGERIAILEGAMGFYDGVAGTEACSAWELAKETDTPVVLVLRPEGAGVTLAAQVEGMRRFRPDSHIAGLLLCDCKPMLYAYLSPILARETGLAVLGYLPPMEEARIESRHLGLLTAQEIGNFSERFAKIAKQMEETVDLDALLSLAGGGQWEGKEDGGGSESQIGSKDESRQGSRIGEKGRGGQEGRIEEKDRGGQQQDARVCAGESGSGGNGQREAAPAFAVADAPAPVRIAVAMDEAFCFYYADNLDLLRESGADLQFFSPLRDAALPEGAAGLYLGGGYPELYARQLSENRAMCRAIREAVEGGMPTVAECGGFLYLQSQLGSPEGVFFPMSGVLPGRAGKTARLQRFGYLYLCPETDSLLFRAGERVPAHEFHYWDSDENGGDLLAEKPGGRKWRCGYATESLYAAFPHLHFGGETPLAERFARAAMVYDF